MNKGWWSHLNRKDVLGIVRNGWEIGVLKHIQNFKDLVKRTPKTMCCFWGDGEHIVAVKMAKVAEQSWMERKAFQKRTYPYLKIFCIISGSARQHALYIWEKKYGNLVKILHGTRGELLLDVVWHPVRPIIASVSSGVVSVWSQNQVVSIGSIRWIETNFESGASSFFIKVE